LPQSADKTSIAIVALIMVLSVLLLILLLALVIPSKRRPSHSLNFANASPDGELAPWRRRSSPMRNGHGFMRSGAH
jgi:hypothetical protein